MRHDITSGDEENNYDDDKYEKNAGDNSEWHNVSELLAEAIVLAIRHVDCTRRTLGTYSSASPKAMLSTRGEIGLPYASRLCQPEECMYAAPVPGS